MFTVALAWVTAWNNEDLTTTLKAGSRFMVSITSSYTSNAYCQLRITSYSDKAVYYVVRSGSVWKQVRQVSFANTDTKNTAGSTNTNSKIYLIGATSQADNPVTYSQNTVFADADGVLNVQKLNINTTDGTPQIKMSRTSNNYIQIPAEGRLCICPSDTLGLETSTLQVSATDVRPGTTTINLGTSTYKWNNVYAKTFRGNIIAPEKVTTPLIGSADGTVLNIAPSSTLYLKSGTSSSLIFSPQGTEKARFDTSGNFLIKTLMYPAPTNTLDLGSSTYKWKSVYATTFEGDLDGNAATATKLKKAFTLSLDGAASDSVTIDGEFDRKLTINGIKESYLTWGGQSLSGRVSVIDAAMSSVHSANRFAFGDPAGVTIEYSNDGGTTWLPYDTTDGQKVRLISGIGHPYYIGGHDTTGTHTINDKLRISLCARQMNIYTRLRKILINMNSNYSTGCTVHVEHSTYEAQTTFANDGVWNISGWSGWNSLDMGGISFGSTQKKNWYTIRLTFSVGAVNSNTTKNSALTITDIAGYGDTYWGYNHQLAKDGHMYTYDENQNVTFAGALTVKNRSIYINGTSADSILNTGFQLQHNGVSIGKLFCSKAGTTSQGGTCQLVLGNAKASTATQNARGSIMIYSAAATGVTLLAHTIGTSYSYYFRNHDATIYSVGTSTREAVGNESTPVYVNSNGFLTPCTSLSSGTDSEGNIITDTYLKLSGGTVSGEVNSSATVNTSSAAFRNIKVLAPGTEVIAGTTAIPTGEIWVSYEE